MNEQQAPIARVQMQTSTTHGDVGPVRHTILHMDWTFGPGASGSTQLRVAYQVNYPSVWRRGRGIDPDVRLHSIDRQIKGEWIPAQLDGEQERALIDAIAEQEELGAPLADC